jgi:hypothetical protein
MALAIVLAEIPAAAGDDPRFAVELEVGPVWQSRNKVEIPNDWTATRFSLKELAGSGPWPAGRIDFTWNIKGRHGMRLPLAPLSFTETGTFDQPVIFAGEAYAAGVPTEGTYQFNSWRATYRYRFRDGKRWIWWIGATAKVRDAKVELRQGAITSKDTDLGFVPLLHLRGDYHFSERWGLAFGYRTVEGGADVDEVYSFAWFH